MGELRLPGLATGIDTAALIDQMMVINSRRLAKYQVKKVGYESQVTALDELRTEVNALKLSAGNLSDADDMDTFSANSSDKDILTLSASSDAEMGAHSVEINQLATTETWIQDVSTFDYETDYVGGGTFIYSYNNKETTITAVADETTLEDFVNLINNDENNPGVSASLLKQGGKYHLMLSGQNTGEDYQISVNASSTEVWSGDIAFTLKSDSSQNASLTTKITELTQFGDSDLGGGEEIRITGTDRSGGAIDTDPFVLSVTSNTTLAHVLDAIEEAFDDNVKATLEDGVIVVTDTTSGASQLSISFQAFFDNGSGATLTLPTMECPPEAEGGVTTEDLTSLGSTSFVQTQAAQNSEIRIDGFPVIIASSEEQTLSADGDPNGGSFTLTYNGDTTGDIGFEDGEAAIQAAINGLNTVNPGDITVAAGAKGIQDGNIIFTFRDTLGDVNMILFNDSNLEGSPNGNLSIEETTKGSLINPWITRNSNTITDVLTGVAFNLQDVTEAGEPVEITISRSTGGVLGKVKVLATAYNTLLSNLKSKTGYDAEARKMGILNGNIVVSYMKAQIKNPFIGITDGFVNTDDSFVQASDLGISFDGSGMMEIDSDEFNDAINENYLDVLKLLGATKSGTSTSSAIEFHAASDRHTTAGVYEVEVDVNVDDEIEAVRIRLYGESQWRTAGISWTGNGVITANSEFVEGTNDPLYPEHSLQLKVDLAEGNYTATIRVTQGIAGILEDLLATTIESGGRFDTSDDILDDKIKAMQTRIEKEERRLDNVQTRLIEKYARLEKTLTMMQQQMGIVNAITAATFG